MHSLNGYAPSHTNPRNQLSPDRAAAFRAVGGPDHLHIVGIHVEGFGVPRANPRSERVLRYRTRTPSSRHRQSFRFTVAAMVLLLRRTCADLLDTKPDAECFEP